MNAYAVKPNVAFVSKNKLSRTPASPNGKAIAEYLDSHNFSFSVNDENRGIVSITKK